MPKLDAIRVTVLKEPIESRVTPGTKSVQSAEDLISTNPASNTPSIASPVPIKKASKTIVKIIA